MPEITPKLKLKKPYGNEAVNRMAYNENLDLVDANAASQDDFDSHKTRAVLDHPDNSVTDAKIGERTISDTTVPAGNTGLLTSLFGGLAYMVRMITGKSDWRTAPAMNLEDVRVKLVEAVPPGAIMYFARSIPPTGWLKANGAVVSRSVYSNLFAAIGTTYGVGDGSTTFTLPDLRGEFIRVWDDGRGVDSGRLQGSWQSDQFKSHDHGGVTGQDYPDHSHYYEHGWQHGGGNWSYDDFNSGFYGANTGGASTRHNHSINTQGGTETRPRNMAFLACIKF